LAWPVAERKCLIPKRGELQDSEAKALYPAALCGIQKAVVHPFLGALMPDPTSAAVRGKSIPRASLHTVEADGVRVFYREAGPADAPVLLLLHGYPASSHMFRELIPRMATSYRVIAPDLPGFGFTSVPLSAATNIRSTRWRAPRKRWWRRWD